MTGVQITLLIAGSIVFIVSFFLPAGKQSRGRGKNGENDIAVITDDHVKLMVEKEIDDSKSNISEIVDETITYSMEKGERAMERITNEKIMAINEYSDTVLKEIHKNQQEVVFLYDMLNDKHAALLEMVSQITAVTSELKQAKESAPTLASAPALAPAPAPASAPAAEALEAPAPATATAPAFNLLNPQNMTADQKITQINADNLRILKDKPAIENHETEEAKPRSVDVQISNNRNSNEIILEMHKEGKSNMAIAKTLGLGISEVKLVIDLFED
ncbi:MAG: DUF6115 domain-containing protein [Lachnospiraceae bacterium]|nr:DUF6115 domain-containing protein [Lachnospiraceae bacterium]